jgi:CheY-like chemotaxis protein
MAKILLVEDDKSLREIYGVRLQAEGYTITSAGDGEEALAVAIKERPDLIVSDVMMPKISGFDMLDILRSTTETKDIKVIMMTALSSDDQRARGEALGADRYLVKSQVGIEDVVRTVHDVLGDGIAPAPVAVATPAPIAAPEAVVMPEPIIAPQAAPAPIPAPAPAPVAEPFVVPTFVPEPVAQPVEQSLPPTIDLPVPQFVPTSAPIPEPVIAPVAPVAPVVPEPQPLAPAPTTYEAPAYAPPTAYAPVEPVPAPDLAPPVAVTFPAPQPLQAPTPGVSLPQPTAPFSSNPPASLGDRIINPLPSADGLGGGIADIASQMNQELNAHLQALDQPAAAPAPQPVQYAVPPQPPIPPLPPQPGI